jgi:hypothetical protein
MKMPQMSWRPTTGQLTTVAIAVVFLLIGFWIGWQHRSSTDPATITPSVPRNMRTKSIAVVPTTGTGTTGTGTTGTASTGTATTAPTAVLPPRSQVKVTVLNAGGTSGAAVQVAVILVRLGYATPDTGNVTLPPDLTPTRTTPAAPAPTGTGRTTTARTTTAASTTSTAPAAPPMVVYYRAGSRALGDRLATDLGVAAALPMPGSGVIQAAAPNAQLVVVIGT